MTDIGKKTKLNPNKIAVVVPTYNAENSIERAIKSVLEQDLPDGYSLEVVVVDDCSTDHTAARVKTLQDVSKNLIFVQQMKNGGPSAARNRALEATDAAWFTPLDSDDFMAQGRLSELVLTALEGGWDVVADNLLMTHDDAPETVIRHLWPDKPDGVIELSLAKFVTQNLSAAGSRAELGYIKPLIDRRKAGAGALYRGEMRFGEDYDLYTRLLADKTRFCLIDPQGYYAVHRQHSLSHSQKAVDFERLIMSDKTLLARVDLDRDAAGMVRKHLKESQNEWVWLRAIDAVKARNIGALIGCFFVRPSATFSLIGKLLEQVVVRTGRKVSGRSPT